MRVRRGLLLGLFVALACAGGADAAVDFGPCGGRGACTDVRVPLDRTGRLPGMIDLRVQRLNEDGATLPPVFVFAHEPGASAIRAHVSTDMFGDSSGIEAWVQDERRSVVAIDMRGTGSSGVIR